MSVTCVAPSSVLQRPRSFRRGAGPAAGLFGEIDVDNFAGGGGVGMGFELATGKAFDVAINHDPASIAMHMANHPHTRHICESVWEVNPLELAAGRPVRLAWFSPDCKHFSRAKGAKPVEKKIRGLAWVAVRWAKRVRPRIIMLENVREFMDWGPLTDEMRPCPARKGLTFKKFVGTLRGLGYEVEWKVLNAADYGAPTHRRRLFLIARSDGRAIHWPEKTHGKACLDGNRGTQGPPRGRLDRSGALGALQGRMAKCGIPALRAGSGGDNLPQSAAGQGSAQVGEQLRLSGSSSAGPSDLRPYRTAAECIDWSIPCPSIFDRKKPLAEKTQRRIVLGIFRYTINNARPFIVRICQNGSNGSNTTDVSRPLNTIVTKAEHCLVTPTLVQTGYSERDGQAPRALNIESPLGTVVAGGCKVALVSAMIAKHYGGVVGHEPDRPLGTVTAKDHHSVVSAMLTQFRGSNNGSGGDVQQPAPSQTAKNTPGLVAANLIRMNHGEKQWNAVDGPCPTITAQSNKTGLVYAFFAKYYGNNEHGQAVDAPMHTLTAKHRHGLVTVELGNGEKGVVVKVPASPGVEGGEYVIADIGLRMLTPRELARCQGFPNSYILTGTQSNQVARIGNSVPPQVVEALIRANLGEIAA